jgi:hypothetical protein
VSAQAALQSSHVLLFVLLLVLLSSLHGPLFVAGSTDIPTISARTFCRAFVSTTVRQDVESGT